MIVRNFIENEVDPIHDKVCLLRPVYTTYNYLRSGGMTFYCFSNQVCAVRLEKQKKIRFTRSDWSRGTYL